MKNETMPIKEIKADLMNAHEVGLVERGEALKSACNNVGEKYLDVCRWIRTSQIAPRRVTELLQPLGFAKQRITEINRVSQCADELWNEFEARKMGMKSVLLLERGKDGGIGGAGEDISEVLEVAEAEETEPSAGKSADDVRKAKLATMQKCAKTILNAGEFLNITKPKKWTLHNGWSLVLTKDKKVVDKSMKPVKLKVRGGKSGGPEVVETDK